MGDRDWEALTEELAEVFDSYPLTDHISNIESRVKRLVDSLKSSYDENMRKQHAKQFSQDCLL